MGSGYRSPKNIEDVLRDLQRQLNEVRSTAGIKSAVIYDPDTGSRIRLGDGQISFWDDYDAYPNTFGRLHCDPGAGINYLRMFPPYSDGNGLQNSLTLQGRRPGQDGHVWIYSDGSIILQTQDSDAQPAGEIFLTSPRITLNASQLALYSLPTTGAAANLRLDTIGGVWTVGWVTSSRRYKQDIEDAPIDPADVLQLQGRTWRQKTDVELDEDTSQRYVGFIAEEVDEAGLGLFVDYDDEGRPDAIQYDRMSVALLELAKAQQKQLDEQADQIAALTARLDALEATA